MPPRKTASPPSAIQAKILGSVKVEAELKADGQLVQLEKDKESLAEQKKHNQRTHEIHNLRKCVMFCLFSLIAMWLGSILIMVAATGFLWWVRLSDGVLITLITTTTASVLGLFLTAMNWLFPKDPH